MSTEDTAKAISSAKKKRGVAKASITRLSNRLTDVEARADNPNAALQAQQMLKNLEAIHSDFRTHHLTLIGLLEDEDTLVTEQATLDLHDDIVADLTTRLNVIISSRTSDTSTEQ